MARVSIEFDEQRVRSNIRNFPRKLEREIDAVLDYETLWAIAWLKGNAPWTDRTGAARSGLLAVVNKLGPGSHEMVLSYSVYYGIWLEVANSGRYAVITPGMRVIGDHIMRSLSHIIDRMK